MKTHVTPVLIVLCFSYATAQNIKVFYQFTEDSAVMPTSDINGTINAAAALMTVNKGYKFKVESVAPDKNSVVISFLQWGRDGNENSEENLKYVYASTEVSGIKKARKDERLYFKLSTIDLLTKAVPTDELPKAGFLLGAVTTPIKMRFGNGKDRYFDLTSNVNLGVSVGYKIRVRDNFFIAPMTGVSITAVPMTPETTNDAITESTTVACLTVPLSLIFFIDNFQIGISGGYDIPSGKIGQDWIYRNSPWLGIGIGYSIFEITSKPEAQRNR